MAKKDIESEEKEDHKRGRKAGKNSRKKVELKDETTDSIWGISFLVFGLIVLLSIFKMAGVVGDFIYSWND